MADGSPQLEDGHIRIANELFDAILRFPLGRNEAKVMYAILRKTYGYGKKQDDMTVTQLANLTGITRPRASEALTALASINAVRKTDGHYGYVLAVNKNYAEWQRTENVRVRKTYGGRTKNVRGAYEKRTHKRQLQKTTTKENGRINKNYGAWGDPVPKHETVPKQDVPKQDADRPKTGQLASQNRTHKRQLQKTTTKENGQTAFDQFWLAYPRKEKKQEARKAWQALKPCETLTAEIVKALTQHKRQEQWQTRKFIPHPATWLRARQWEDELAPESAGYKPQPFGVYA